MYVCVQVIYLIVSIQRSVDFMHLLTVLQPDLAGAYPVRSERPGRCAAAVRSGRTEDRRGVHRQLHDQYRTLQR
jgi:hypothetical protein